MSGNVAIRAEGLGKRYLIHSGRARDDSLRNLIVGKTKALLDGEWRSPSEREFWALRDVAFDIRHGENVGIIGLNGAGKSTLLKILSRITEPTTGRARIDGRVGALLEVGTGFHIDLTGRDNIFLYGSILGMRRDEVRRKFDAIVDFSGIGAHIDTPVKRYSSGMYVRLAFAVAAHLEPDILFLDEVLAVGDLAFQRKCIEFAKQLQARDATILFVSHNMFSIKTMCDRLIYLKKGCVEYDGAVDHGIEIYERDCRLSTVGWRGASHPDEWPVFINHCAMFGGSGQTGTLFELGEVVTIRLTYEVRRPVHSPNFMVSFVRSDGVTCCTYSTEVDGLATGCVSSAGVIELRIPPLKLVAEMYTVHVTVRDKGFQQILCAQVATTFHVRDSLLDINFGVFHEPAKWRLEGEAVAGVRQAGE